MDNQSKCQTPSIDFSDSSRIAFFLIYCCRNLRKVTAKVGDTIAQFDQLESVKCMTDTICYTIKIIYNILAATLSLLPSDNKWLKLNQVLNTAVTNMHH